MRPSRCPDQSRDSLLSTDEDNQPPSATCGAIARRPDYGPQSTCRLIQRNAANGAGAATRAAATAAAAPPATASTGTIMRRVRAAFQPILVDGKLSHLRLGNRCVHDLGHVVV